MFGKVGLIPNVTILPELANFKACCNPILKFSSQVIKWSEERISKIGSSLDSKDWKAAKAIDAAVFLPMGSRIIEKHFTLDNKFSNFRDHALSSNPKEMKYLVESIRETEAILGDGIKKIEDCEKKSIIQTRRSIAASSDLKKGDKVQTKDLSWIRPGGGIRPGNEDLLIGKTLERDLNEGEFFKEEFVE